jgi:hypothetical protein
MCQICDGATIDQVRLGLARIIDTHGWAVQGVTGETDAESWAYTVGLVERFGHPELVVTGINMKAAWGLLNDLADRVRDGERFAAGETIDLDGVDVGFANVHPAQFSRGVFAMWFDHYRAVAPAGLNLSALQVILPDWLFCARHARHMPRLDRPDPALGHIRPNRAERRSRARSNTGNRGRGRSGRRQNRRRR